MSQPPLPGQPEAGQHSLTEARAGERPESGWVGAEMDGATAMFKGETSRIE